MKLKTANEPFQGKVLVMRVFIIILVLIFSVQSWTRADDISDFEIEGISIGDNALDYFSESEIESNKRYYYKSKKYATFVKVIENSNFEGIQIEFRDDGKYIIESLIGKIYYNNKDFNECYNQEKIILYELKKLFKKNAIYTDHGIEPHEYDETGKSKGSWHTFELTDGSGFVYLECMNWSEKIQFYDNLKLTILNSNFGEFLKTEAY